MGVPGLDKTLAGGVPEGRFYLLQGDPGTGKTTLALQFLLEGVRLGEASLYVTLSETRHELEEVARSHGWDISGLALHELSSSDVRLSASEQNTLFYPAEVELNETVERVMALVEKVRPKRLVFDSLSEMRLLAGEALSYRRQILLLKERLSRYGATVFFLDDKTAEGGPDSQLLSLAHGVIELSRKTAEFGGVRRQLEIIKMRGVRYASGLHDLTLMTGGLRVHPRLVAAEHSKAFDREVLGSGSPELDALQRGGLVRGTSTLLLGPSGCGKSTVASMFVRATLSAKKRVAVFNFDECDRTFFGRTQGVGIDLQAAVDSGELLVKQVDPATIGPGEFVSMVRDVVEQSGVELVLIDSLNGYFNAMPGKDFLALHMHDLLTYLQQMGCTTLVTVAQSGLVGTMKSTVDMTYLSDSVLLFRFFEVKGRVRKALSVVKKRIGGHEDTIRELLISNSGVTVGEPLEDFHGVLTGTPTYVGKSGSLLHGGLA